jgi:hypothetical protein
MGLSSLLLIPPVVRPAPCPTTRQLTTHVDDDGCAAAAPEAAGDAPIVANAIPAAPQQDLAHSLRKPIHLGNRKFSNH